MASESTTLTTAAPAAIHALPPASMRLEHVSSAFSDSAGHIEALEGHAKLADEPARPLAHHQHAR